MENKQTIGEYIDPVGFYSIQAYESFNNGEKYFEFYFKGNKSNDLYLGIENHSISGLILLFRLLAKKDFLLPKRFIKF